MENDAEENERTPLKVAVYYDCVYRRDGNRTSAERPFVLFLVEMALQVDELVLIGRVHPTPGQSHYDIPDGIEVAPLPYYSTMTNPVEIARTVVGTIRQCWQVFGRVDVVWLMGPHPLSFVMTLLAALRRTQVVLGVRQDLPVYVRSRHPGRRWIHCTADLLERSFRLLARRYPAIVYGPGLAHNYRHATRLLEILVSLTRDADVVPVEQALTRSYDDQLCVLSVGRIEQEKNPLLLADVLALLQKRDTRCRMVICGEGRLTEALRSRFEELGVLDKVEMMGHVPIDGGLQEIYRRSHMLAHVSWSEGVPQVLFEAFAAALPVVATQVGGVPDAVGDAALLVPPGDAEAVASALERVASDEALRETMIERGNQRVRTHTLEAESRKVVRFLTEVRRVRSSS